MVTQTHKFIKTYQYIYLINLHFIACKLHFSKVGLKKLTLLGVSDFPDKFKRHSHRLPSGLSDCYRVAHAALIICLAVSHSSVSL